MHVSEDEGDGERSMIKKEGCYAGIPPLPNEIWFSLPIHGQSKRKALCSKGTFLGSFWHGVWPVKGRWWWWWVGDQGDRCQAK